MTDLEQMKAMLAKAGIEHVEQRRDFISSNLGDLRDVTILTVERGYSYFVSQLVFDQSGNLLTIEAYE